MAVRPRNALVNVRSAVKPPAFAKRVLVLATFVPFLKTTIQRPVGSAAVPRAAAGVTRPRSAVTSGAGAGSPAKAGPARERRRAAATNVATWRRMGGLRLDGALTEARGTHQ